MSITALLFVIEGIDAATGRRMDDEGIEPRHASGLVGVLVSPFLHADWNHLVSNTVPGVVRGFLVLLTGRFLWVTLMVWFTSGMGVWLIGAPGTVTTGASGIIFGWLAFILVRGIFSRVVWQIALGVVALITYGGVLWGALPGTPGIAWQADAFGAASGVLAAWYFGVRERYEGIGRGIGGSPDSVVRAAHRRIPTMLAIIGGDPARFLPYADLYRRAQRELDSSAMPLAVHSPGFVAATDAEAADLLWEYYRAFGDRHGAERGWARPGAASSTLRSRRAHCMSVHRIRSQQRSEDCTRA